MDLGSLANLYNLERGDGETGGRQVTLLLPLPFTLYPFPFPLAPKPYRHPKLSRVDTPVTGLIPSARSHSSLA
jgi:hypothetical protein